MRSCAELVEDGDSLSGARAIIDGIGTEAELGCIRRQRVEQRERMRRGRARRQRHWRCCD